MNWLMVVPWVQITGFGGVPSAMWKTAEGLLSLGGRVDVAATQRGPAGRDDLPATAAAVELNLFPAYGSSGWCVSPALDRWLARHVGDYDAVYIHGIWPFPCFRAAHWAYSQGCPYVVQPHGQLMSWTWRKRRWLKRAHYRAVGHLAMVRAAAVVVTSQMEADETEALEPGVPRLLVPLAVGGTQAVCLPAPVPELRLLFLGRLSPEKALPTLFEALARLRESGAEARLTVAGSGPEHLQDSLRELARRLGVADLIVWAGWVPAEGQAALFASHDVFVLVSHKENFGLAAAEAMASSLPVVVSDQVGLAVEVREAGAGLVVPAGDAPALALALAEMCDPRRREALARAAWQLARLHWSDAAARAALAELGRRVRRRRTRSLASSGQDADVEG